jgi:acyl carrier protein
VVTREELIAALREVGAQVLSVPVERITLAASLREDLGMDSIDMFDVLALIEQRFSVNIERDHFREVRTISDVVEVLLTKYEAELRGQA